MYIVDIYSVFRDPSLIVSNILQPRNCKQKILLSMQQSRASFQYSELSDYDLLAYQTEYKFSI